MAISSAMPFQAAAAQPMAVPMAAPSSTAGHAMASEFQAPAMSSEVDVAAEMIGAEEADLERPFQAQGDAHAGRRLGRPDERHERGDDEERRQDAADDEGGVRREGADACS